MDTIEEVLMKRDGMSRKEANEIVQEMKDEVQVYGQDPEEVLYDWNLELDYMMELLT